MINSLGEIFFRWMWGESCCGGSDWLSDEYKHYGLGAVHVRGIAKRPVQVRKGSPDRKDAFVIHDARPTRWVYDDFTQSLLVSD